MPEVDLLIIGAGPTGLYAAYYAGFRGLSVAVVDSLPELGGQITAMYPEKAILDVAGFPTIKGRDLVEGLVAQAATADPQYFLDRTALTLTHGEGHVVVGLDDGTEISAGALLVTAGIGKFSPRPLPAADGWVGRGVEFFVPSFAPYAGKDVVIVGGGDSAFDWAQHLEPMAALGHPRPPPRRLPGPRAHGEGRAATPASTSSPRPRSPRCAAGRGTPGTSRRSRSPWTGRTPSSARRRPSWPRWDSSPTSAPSRPGDSRPTSGTSSWTARCAPTWSGSSPPATSPSTPARSASSPSASARRRQRSTTRPWSIDPTAHVFPGHSSEA